MGLDDMGVWIRVQLKAEQVKTLQFIADEIGASVDIALQVLVNEILEMQAESQAETKAHQPQRAARGRLP